MRLPHFAAHIVVKYHARQASAKRLYQVIFCLSSQRVARGIAAWQGRQARSELRTDRIATWNEFEWAASGGHMPAGPFARQVPGSGNDKTKENR